MTHSNLTGRKARKGTGGRPTAEEAAALADRILDIAWQLFVTRGYELLSIDAIAKEASVSKRTIYDRFQSKNGLFEALFERASQEWTEQAKAVLSGHRDGDWLRPLIDYILDLMAREDYLAFTSFLIIERHALPEAVRKEMESGESALDAFVQYFSAHVENYPAGDEGRLIARSIVALVGGWTRFYRNAEPRSSDPFVRERICNEVRALLDFYGCGPLKPVEGI